MRDFFNCDNPGFIGAPVCNRLWAGSKPKGTLPAGVPCLSRHREFSFSDTGAFALMAAWEKARFKNQASVASGRDSGVMAVGHCCEEREMKRILLLALLMTASVQSPGTICAQSNGVNKNTAATNSQRAQTQVEPQPATNDFTIEAKDISINIFPKRDVPDELSPSQVAELKASAEAGDPKAQGDVGIMYYAGKGLPRDYQQARYWFRRAADQGETSAEALYGTLCLGGIGGPVDLPEARRRIEAAAKKGDTDSQFNLGQLYRAGVFGKSDDREAVNWFRLASEQGHAEAQYALAGAYLMGIGVAKDVPAATRLLEQAAQKGVAGAQNDLGALALRGREEKVDYPKALTWLNKAAAQGYAQAYFNLGIAYRYGKGVKVDLVEACKWFQLGADAHFHPAAEALAELAPKLKLMREAEAGASEAQYQMGELFREGKTIGKDFEQAVKWYWLASDQGNAKAQYALGSAYMMAAGVAKDVPAAIRLFEQAATGGSAEAQNDLGFVYLNGHEVAADYAKALHWLNKAAAQGKPRAYYNLGCAYRDGKGVKADSIEAYKWYQLATENTDYQEAVEARTALMMKLSGGDIVEALRRVKRFKQTREVEPFPATGTNVAPPTLAIPFRLGTDEVNAAVFGRQCAIIWFASESKLYSAEQMRNDILVASKFAKALGVPYSEEQFVGAFNDRRVAGNFDSLFPKVIEEAKGGKVRGVYLFSLWCASSQLWARPVYLWQEPEKRKEAIGWAAFPLAKAQKVANAYDSGIASRCQELGVRALSDPFQTPDQAEKFASEVLALEKAFLLKFMTPDEVAMATQSLLKRKR